MMVLVTTRKGVTVFVEGETKGERKKEERMREGEWTGEGREGFWRLRERKRKVENIMSLMEKRKC